MKNFRFLTSGESHGKCLNAIIEGVPAGFRISEEEINKDLKRRQGGYGRGKRMQIETDKCEMVRSKSEVIMANILYQYRKDLLYKYERPLEVMMAGKVQTMHPDFTILNLHTGIICYWEHAGRMDDSRYANQFVQKMNLYLENDIFQGENLIVTYETMNFPLNIQNVKTIIQRLVRS